MGRRGKKSGKIEDILISFYVWLEGGKVERWKLFYLVKKRNKKIENRVCINLSSYSY
mgnify:CR=1 FL=1